MYSYLARCVKVVDGDTYDFDVDLGFHMTARIRVRLRDADTPELRGEEREAGKAAKEFVLDVMPPASLVHLQTTKTGKYGRWLGDITLTEGTHPGKTLTNLLREAGHLEDE